MPLLSSIEWENFLGNFPDAHILQTRPWGDLKQAFGWKVAHLGVSTADSSGSIGAQILFKKLPLGFNLAYIPRGPVGVSGPPGSHPLWGEWLSEVDQLCRRRKAVFLKIEPDLWRVEGETSLTAEDNQLPEGFLNSHQDIQPSRTILVDLRGNEEDVLARMKQKTRYNIRLALKKGVIVKPSQDLATFHRLMTLTAQRDLFGVHSLAYYQRAFDLFHSYGACQIFVAEYEGEALAAIMVFSHGKRAWYFYGASSDEHRDRMPAYLLQWEAIRWARERGCTQYDLWGVPDHNLQSLEDNFLNRSTGLWGVYRFKRGFGGELKRTQGPWDRVYQPILYSLYLAWVKFKERGHEA